VSLPCIKNFFFLFLKTNFIFSEKRFLQAVGITEPHVEIHFHRRFSVTRLWKKFISTGHQTQGVRQTACKKGLRTAYIVPLCVCTSECWTQTTHTFLIRHSSIKVLHLSEVNLTSSALQKGKGKKYHLRMALIKIGMGRIVYLMACSFLLLVIVSSNSATCQSCRKPYF